ncbi:MAG: hypothetical protein ACOZNI_09880 [Myxococcota bacterium]
MNPMPSPGALPPDLLLVLRSNRASLLRLHDGTVRALVGIPLSARIGPDVLTGALRRLLTGPRYRRLLVAVSGEASDAGRQALAAVRVPRDKRVVWLPGIEAIAQAVALTTSSPILDAPGAEPHQPQLEGVLADAHDEGDAEDADHDAV